jgi:hypothetical protein
VHRFSIKTPMPMNNNILKTMSSKFARMVQRIASEHIDDDGAVGVCPPGTCPFRTKQGRWK